MPDPASCAAGCAASARSESPGQDPRAGDSRRLYWRPSGVGTAGSAEFSAQSMAALGPGGGVTQVVKAWAGSGRRNKHDPTLPSLEQRQSAQTSRWSVAYRLCALTSCAGVTGAVMIGGWGGDVNRWLETIQQILLCSHRRRSQACGGVRRHVAGPIRGG